jgi:hypothetical protein
MLILVKTGCDPYLKKITKNQTLLAASNPPRRRAIITTRHGSCRWISS